MWFLIWVFDVVIFEMALNLRHAVDVCLEFRCESVGLAQRRWFSPMSVAI